MWRVKISARQITGILVAVIISALIARYDEILPYRWQRFNASDGSFSALFPANPEVASREVESATGAVIVMHEVTATPSKSTTYFCGYFDDPRLAGDTVEEALNSARDGGIANVEGHLVSEQRLEVSGHPARDIEARARGNSILDMRLVVEGQRVFILMVVGQNADSKNVHKFFESLQLPN
jgi:hypothetical protein